MGRVKDLHGKIGSVVSHLNEKIALVLQKQEKEFLAAYRAHMLSVQKELQQLRAKANEAELAMKKNEKIRSLEDERNWYRKEALRLDKFATAMKKDLKYMKEKLESIGAWLVLCLCYCFPLCFRSLLPTLTPTRSRVDPACRAQRMIASGWNGS